MASAGNSSRVDSGSRLIRATSNSIYRALIDPKAIVAWRPPQGMRAEIREFDPRVGGAFRMALFYLDEAIPGKTSENADVIRGRFVDLVPDRRVVERIEFESDDAAFDGAMTVSTILEAAPEGTKVTIRCENVPAGISQADHQEGIASTLANLAAFTE